MLAYTVELAGGSGDPVGGTDGSDPNLTPGGFVFQDSEAAVQAVFEKNLAFALDLARSADRPDKPVSQFGNSAADLIPTKFPTSNGTPQTIEVNAKRSLGRVTANYKINDGPTRRTSTYEWRGGERYPLPGLYYHKMRARISGMRPGDRVRVWFTAARSTSEAFEYTVTSDSNASVLLMVAEDYTGRSSLQGNGPYGAAPFYRQDYEDALKAAGIRYDVYDVDAAGRVAATHLGVLSHYRAVVWETGDDDRPRPRPGAPGWPGVGRHHGL
jgi:hypothetical protein